MHDIPDIGVYVNEADGTRYYVLGTALHEETGEYLVVFRPLQGESTLRLQPPAVFWEHITVIGSTVYRVRNQ